MGALVGDVVELVGPDRAVRQLLVQLFGQALRHLDVVVGVLVGLGRHLDQLGAVKPQRVLFFLALRIGNDDHRFEAQGIGHQRQPDPGIACRALDNGAAGLERAALDRIVDDEQRRAILDRLARIEEFGLAPDIAAGQRRKRG